LLRLVGSALPLIESNKDCFSLYIGEMRCDLSAYLSKVVYGSLHYRRDSQELVNPYQLPYQPGTFHTIILCDVFCQLRYLGTALDEFARVLHPDGFLICIEPYTTKRMKENAVENNWAHPSREKAFHEANSYDASIPSTIFFHREWISKLSGWQIVRAERYSARSLRSIFLNTTLEKEAVPGRLQRRIAGFIDIICNFIPSSGMRHLLSDRCTVVIKRR
jgi:SAM-dependent methyltransferase